MTAKRGKHPSARKRGPQQARVTCPRCGGTKERHRVCPECHYYRGELRDTRAARKERYYSHA